MEEEEKEEEEEEERVCVGAGRAAVNLNCCVNISAQLAHHKIFPGVIWLAINEGLEKAIPKKGGLQGVHPQHSGRFLGRIW